MSSATELLLASLNKDLEAKTQAKEQTGEYGFSSNAEDIEPNLRLEGKNVVITGGYSGTYFTYLFLVFFFFVIVPFYFFNVIL